MEANEEWLGLVGHSKGTGFSSGGQLAEGWQVLTSVSRGWLQLLPTVVSTRRAIDRTYRERGAE